MEQVVTRENATEAWLAVKRNRGTAGIDRMTTEQLRDHGGERRQAQGP